MPLPVSASPKPPASPTRVTYTLTSTASGDLGGTAFTDALVTVTLTGDTSGVFEPFPLDFPGVFMNVGTATVSIEGLGTHTLNSPNGYAAVGGAPIPPDLADPWFIIAQFDAPGQIELLTHILGVVDPSFASYDFQSPFAALTGTGFGVVTGDVSDSATLFLTDAGILMFAEDSGGDPVTSAATVDAVPEPASLSLFAMGALGAMAARRRRRAQRNS